MEQMAEVQAGCPCRYRVRSIREDDYGCEERPEGVEPTVLVELEDEDGQVSLLRQKDRYLYEHQIDEGDLVILEQELLKKAESSGKNEQALSSEGFVRKTPTEQAES